MIATVTWRQIRWLCLLYAVLLEAMLVIAILMWPTIRDETAALRPLRTLVNVDFMRQWFDGVMDHDASAAYLAYVALQVFFKGGNVVGLACACLYGTALIARERETGTLELLLSRPMSRSRILLVKFLVTAAAIMVPLLLTTWTAIPLSWAIGEALPFWGATWAAVYAALFCVLFLAVTSACSTRLRTQVDVAFVVGAVLVVQLCIYFVPVVRDASIFRWADFEVFGPILAGHVGPVDLLFGRAGVLLLAIAVIMAIADRCLRRAEA